MTKYALFCSCKIQPETIKKFKKTINDSFLLVFAQKWEFVGLAGLNKPKTS